MDIDPTKRSLTLAEFCVLERLSRSKYYALKKRGLNPSETSIDGTLRISPEAREEWRQRMIAHSRSQAAQLEAERRRQSAVLAGKAAAASPHHVSKQKQQKQKPPPRGRAGRFSKPRDIEAC